MHFQAFPFGQIRTGFQVRCELVFNDNLNIYKKTGHSQCPSFLAVAIYS